MIGNAGIGQKDRPYYRRIPVVACNRGGLDNIIRAALKGGYSFLSKKKGQENLTVYIPYFYCRYG